MYLFATKLATKNYFIKLKFVPLSDDINDWNFGC